MVNEKNDERDSFDCLRDESSEVRQRFLLRLHCVQIGSSSPLVRLDGIVVCFSISCCQVVAENDRAETYFASMSLKAFKSCRTADSIVAVNTLSCRVGA